MRKLFKLGLPFFIMIAIALVVVQYDRINKPQFEFADQRVNQIFKMRNLSNELIKEPKTEFLILNFWASWCPPCIEETPSLVRFTEKYADRFTLIALSQDSTKKDIENFIKTFPSLRSPFITVVHDDSQTIARSFGVDKMPETFIYSMKQSKYFKVSGSTNWEQPEVISTLNKFFNVSIK